jgi:1-deoxy-D-xylulose-5-phosphate synthase
VEPAAIAVGEAELLQPGSDLLFVGFGPIVMRALETAHALEADGWSVAVINARFAAPLDAGLILSHAQGKRLIITFEESVETCGFGSGVLEVINRAALADATLRGLPVQIVGLPAGSFVEHGPASELRRVLRLDAAGLEARVREVLAELGLEAPALPRVLQARSA